MTKAITVEEGLHYLLASLMQTVHRVKPSLDAVLEPAGILAATTSTAYWSAMRLVERAADTPFEQAIGYSLAGLSAIIAGHYSLPFARTLYFDAVLRKSKCKALTAKGEAYSESRRSFLQTIGIGAAVGVSYGIPEVVEKAALALGRYSEPINLSELGCSGQALEHSVEDMLDESIMEGGMNELMILRRLPLSMFSLRDGLAYPVDADTPINSTMMRVRRLNIGGSATRRQHQGLDLETVIGSMVHAPLAGTVKEVGEDSSRGRYIILEHAPLDGKSRITKYFHLEVTAQEAFLGAKIQQGQTIAFSGNSGNVTGAHLHFEYHLDGTPVNPLIPPASMEGIEAPYQALLDVVAWALHGQEDCYSYIQNNASYNLEVHPNTVRKIGSIKTTAAGRYGITYSEFEQMQNDGLFVSGFTPWEQDRAAVQMVKDSGVDVEMIQRALERSDFSELANQLGNSWPSIPCGDCRGYKKRDKPLYREEATISRLGEKLREFYTLRLVPVNSISL
ncbi:M23 family metallopeptidase [Candidatus Woesearchaeota archaeon]|nr:M23 family metallopeptidase [Candidatus Woesearchaeota archaeon]